MFYIQKIENGFCQKPNFLGVQGNGFCMIYAYNRLRYQVSIYRTIGPLVSLLSLYLANFYKSGEHLQHHWSSGSFPKEKSISLLNFKQSRSENKGGLAEWVRSLNFITLNHSIISPLCLV